MVCTNSTIPDYTQYHFCTITTKDVVNLTAVSGVFPAGIKPRGFDRTHFNAKANVYDKWRENRFNIPNKEKFVIHYDVALNTTGTFNVSVLFSDGMVLLVPVSFDSRGVIHIATTTVHQAIWESYDVTDSKGKKHQLRRYLGNNVKIPNS